ncbi:hypothetical protein HanIR_Chr16g0805021 [Helianthus annuus]|nr:hypothetical protein HanIR_Chr16g0805021 [Helianthus annuus]
MWVWLQKLVCLARCPHILGPNICFLFILFLIKSQCKLKLWIYPETVICS